jgi:hypothetical protein
VRCTVRRSEGGHCPVIGKHVVQNNKDVVAFVLVCLGLPVPNRFQDVFLKSHDQPGGQEIKILVEPRRVGENHYHIDFLLFQQALDELRDEERLARVSLGCYT